MCRCLELRIAAPTPPAARDYDAIVWPRKIVYFLARVGVINNGSDRHFEHDVHALTPGFIRTFTVAPALRLVFRIEAEMNQRVVALAGLHDDVAAFAAVPAGWTSAWNKLFAPEGEAAVPAVAGLHANCGLFNEHAAGKIAKNITAGNSWLCR